MASTAEQLRPLRNRFAEILGGPVELQSWEIAVLHRALGDSTRAVHFAERYLAGRNQV